MATETVPADVTSQPDDAVRAALQRASEVLYDNHRAARALLALLETADFADALSCTGGDDHYNLLYAIEQLLAQVRDRSDQASKQADTALRTEAAA